MQPRRPLHAALLLLGLLSGAASATTIDPLTFEELAYSADLFGVVRCVTAGGIVARYQVEEVWIGEAPDEPITLRIETDYWEPQFPIALVGERYVVAAFRSNTPSVIASMTMGGPVPLWWRGVPANYRLPLFQGRIRLPVTEEGLRSELGSEAGDLEILRADCRAFVALPEEMQRLRLLKRLSNKYLFSRDEFADEATEEAVEAAGDLETAIRSLLAYARTGDEPARRGVAAALRKCPGDEVISILQTLEADDSPLGAAHHDRLLQWLRQRRERQDQKPGERPEEPVPTTEELDAYQSVLAEGLSARDFGEAFHHLTTAEPAVVAEYLIGFQNPHRGWRDANLGYELGSAFAARCVIDRAENLLLLLDAEDPMIRVAGAVYLAFEDEEEGSALLRELQELDGDAGGWAALNLARRGRKPAMLRALELFTSPGPSNMEGVPHKNLQRRLIVLLSNSAATSGAPEVENRLEAYERNGDGNFSEVARYYREYWDQHGDAITLADPWLEHCALRKVD